MLDSDKVPQGVLIYDLQSLNVNFYTKFLLKKLSKLRYKQSYLCVSLNNSDGQCFEIMIETGEQLKKFGYRVRYETINGALVLYILWGKD